jgi:hypothetical protein
VTDKKRVEIVRSALRVIATWARFDLEAKYATPALTPGDVLLLCETALRALREEEDK